MRHAKAIALNPWAELLLDSRKALIALLLLAYPLMVVTGIALAYLLKNEPF